jgi:hypothetical protein
MKKRLFMGALALCSAVVFSCQREEMPVAQE